MGMLVHNAMQILDPEHENQVICSLDKDVGNVVASSNVSFEYRIRTDKAAAPQEGDKLPFQLQIRFDTLDGSQYLRVQTLTQEVTAKREEAERGVNVHVLASNLIHQAAHYSGAGRYGKAREKMAVQSRLM